MADETSRFILRMGRRLGFGIIAACLVGCLQEGTNRQQHAITGGKAASGSHPAVVGLVTIDGQELTYHCSGVLIADKAVLSAAHCLPSSGVLGIFVGDSVEEATAGSVVMVDEQIPHPLWVGKGNPPPTLGQANDIALLLLQTTAGPPAQLIRPTDLSDAVSLSSRATIVGFGSQGRGGSTGDKRVAEAKITKVGQYEFQVSAANEPQACDGDSGGPALWTAGDAEVIGVVSREPLDAVACDSGVIYTRVDAYLPFIQDHVQLPCNSGPSAACGDLSTDGAVSDASGQADSDGQGIGSGTGPRISGRPMPVRDDGGCAVVGRDPLLWSVGLLGLCWLIRRRLSM